MCTGINEIKNFNNPPLIDPIANLPTDAIHEILPYLSPQDLQSATRVSKLWHSAITELTRKRQYELFSKFTDSLARRISGMDQALYASAINHLNAFRNALSTAIESEDIYPRVSFISFHKQYPSHIYLPPQGLWYLPGFSRQLQRETSSILGSVSQQDLNTLEKTPEIDPRTNRKIEKPFFFENVFTLAKQNQFIDCINQQKGFGTCDIKRHIQELLLPLSDADKDDADKVMATISQAIGIIQERLCSQEGYHFFRSVFVDDFFNESIQLLLNVGKLDEALRIVKIALNFKYRLFRDNPILTQLLEKLLEVGRVNEAIELAKISLNTDSSFLLIIRALVATGNTQKALEIFKLTDPDGNFYLGNFFDIAFKAIADALIDTSDFKKLAEITDNLEIVANHNIYLPTCQKIGNDLVNRGLIEEACELGRTRVHRSSRNMILGGVHAHLLREGSHASINRDIAILDDISNHHGQQDWAREETCTKLLEMNRTNDAKTVAGGIVNNTKREKVLKEIAEKESQLSLAQAVHHFFNLS